VHSITNYLTTCPSIGALDEADRRNDKEPRICIDPLEKLRKVRKINQLWTLECEDSFQMFKKVLSGAPVLNKPLADVP